MLPMLDYPERHPLRATVLVWAATVAHAAIWVVGVSVYFALDAYGLLRHIEDIILSMVLGIPMGVVFGVIVFVAMSRILNLHFDRRGWFIVIIISAVCGTIYLGAPFNWLINVSQSYMFFSYILWYAATAAVFNLGKPQPQSSITKCDIVLLGGLVLLTILELFWAGVF